MSKTAKLSKFLQHKYKLWMRLPPMRKGFSSSIHLITIWTKKLGIHYSFYRMIQPGIFVIFFKSHAMQKRVIGKDYWNIGLAHFKACPWKPDTPHKEIRFYLVPRWILL